MSYKYKTGAFVKAGGNRVFFPNGVLQILAENNIYFDKIIGMSSSGPIVLAHLLGKNNHGLEIFAKKLDENKKNFYFFRKEHFPHNEIYRSSIADILKFYDNQELQSDFVIFASSLSPRSKRMKSFFATLDLFLYLKGVNMLGFFRLIFHVQKSSIENKNYGTRERLLDFMMGSSTLYPFISPHTVDNRLILEAALLDLDPYEELFDCEKKIIIHTDKGETRIAGDTNILDYTNGRIVRELHEEGEMVMRKNMPALKDFLLIK